MSITSALGHVVEDQFRGWSNGAERVSLPVATENCTELARRTGEQPQAVYFDVDLCDLTANKGIRI